MERSARLGAVGSGGAVGGGAAGGADLRQPARARRRVGPRAADRAAALVARDAHRLAERARAADRPRSAGARPGGALSAPRSAAAGTCRLPVDQQRHGRTSTAKGRLATCATRSLRARSALARAATGVDAPGHRHAQDRRLALSALAAAARGAHGGARLRSLGNDAGGRRAAGRSRGRPGAAHRRLRVRARMRDGRRCCRRSRWWWRSRSS